MKTSHTATTKAAGAEDQLAACMRTLFGGCPELIGLTFHEPDQVPAETGAELRDREQLVLEMGFSTPVSNGEFENVFNRVTAEIQDLVYEDPEVLDLLRGQTFIRTLH